MPQTIQVSDRLFARLQLHGAAFVDSPEDVIERALDAYERNTSEKPSSARPTEPPSGLSAGRPEIQRFAARAPRERGVRARLGNHVLAATSVADLYEQTLKVILDEVSSDRLAALLPFATSNERYLIAKKPIHPNGAAFVRPIQHRGFYMETHKDYRNAVSHLAKLTQKCGLAFQYLGS